MLWSANTSHRDEHFWPTASAQFQKIISGKRGTDSRQASGGGRFRLRHFTWFNLVCKVTRPPVEGMRLRAASICQHKESSNEKGRRILPLAGRCMTQNRSEAFSPLFLVHLVPTWVPSGTISKDSSGSHTGGFGVRLPAAFWGRCDALTHSLLPIPSAQTLSSGKKFKFFTWSFSFVSSSKNRSVSARVLIFAVYSKSGARAAPLPGSPLPQAALPAAACAPPGTGSGEQLSLARMPVAFSECFFSVREKKYFFYFLSGFLIAFIHTK